jgi:hypothetical protein
MIASYQNRTLGVAPPRRLALRFAAAFGLICGLAGCSVSMPLASFVDDTPTGSITAPAETDAAPAGEKLAAATAQPRVP